MKQQMNIFLQENDKAPVQIMKNECLDQMGSEWQEKSSDAMRMNWVSISDLYMYDRDLKMYTEEYCGELVWQRSISAK